MNYRVIVLATLMGAAQCAIVGWRVAPIPMIFSNHAEGAPGPSLLGTGDGTNPNRHAEGRLPHRDQKPNPSRSGLQSRPQKHAFSRQKTRKNSPFLACFSRFTPRPRGVSI
jgi:hypothetical protein